MYVGEPLAPEHKLDAFDCGKSTLNNWLQQHASHAERMGSARTFVWVENSDVLAYYSLAGHALQRRELPYTLGRGSPDETPAVKLGRLALDRRLQGHGLGERLLIDALDRVTRVSTEVAFRFVVVDAIDESAATFYERYGFTRIPGQLRLFRKISDIIADLAD